MKEDAIPGEPHEALFLVLTYLPLYELLATSQVCRSLRHAINNDVLPWLNFVILEPLNRRLSDHLLITLTSQAQGRLSTLALFSCTRITNDGLLSVVATNPLISNLLVPGCTGLTPDGIITAVESLAQQGRRLTCLRINGIYHLDQDHLQTLHSHLLPLSSESQKPRFYHDFVYSSWLSFDQSSHPIDVEICPKCSQVKMVFDCPREACRTTSPSSRCRGCYQCIARCVECGTCLSNQDDDQWQFDAACSDFLCSDCWLPLLKCNYCNKPYCRRHKGEQKAPPDGSTGFVCSNCHSRYLQLPDI